MQVCHSSEIQQEIAAHCAAGVHLVCSCPAAAPQLLTGCVERPPLDGRLELVGQGCRKGGAQPHENADDVGGKVLRLPVGMEKVCE